MDTDRLNLYIMGKFEFYDWNDSFDNVIRTAIKKNQIRIYHLKPYRYNIFPFSCNSIGLSGYGRFAFYFL